MQEYPKIFLSRLNRNFDFEPPGRHCSPIAFLRTELAQFSEPVVASTSAKGTSLRPIFALRGAIVIFCAETRLFSQSAGREERFAATFAEALPFSGERATILAGGDEILECGALGLK
jgi:hypothetical protein